MKSLKKYCEEYLGNLGMLQAGVLGHKPQIDDSVYEKQKEIIGAGISSQRKILSLLLHLVISVLYILFILGILFCFHLLDKYMDTARFLKLALPAFPSLSVATYYLHREISRIDLFLAAMPIMTAKDLAKVIVNIYYKVIK
ncbi:MAG: hypothetical protein HQK99_12990 [Nitrospirae bacterium]|nr:hypothetical protein [Nitrospirota bacterium]